MKPQGKPIAYPMLLRQRYVFPSSMRHELPGDLGGAIDGSSAGALQRGLGAKSSPSFPGEERRYEWRRRDQKSRYDTGFDARHKNNEFNCCSVVLQLGAAAECCSLRRARSHRAYNQHNSNSRDVLYGIEIEQSCAPWPTCSVKYIVSRVHVDSAPLADNHLRLSNLRSTTQSKYSETPSKHNHL